MEELLKLTRENNLLLKQLISYLTSKENNSYLKDFVINYIANRAAMSVVMKMAMLKL